jgi:hypothetical protein
MFFGSERERQKERMPVDSIEAGIKTIYTTYYRVRKLYKIVYIVYFGFFRQRGCCKMTKLTVNRLVRLAKW